MLSLGAPMLTWSMAVAAQVVVVVANESGRAVRTGTAAARSDLPVRSDLRAAGAALPTW